MTEAREGAGQGWVGLRWAMLTRQQPERTQPVRPERRRALESSSSMFLFGELLSALPLSRGVGVSSHEE